MSSNEDLMRAVREIGQEFGKIAEQAGAFVRDAAGQLGGWAGRAPFGGGRDAGRASHMGDADPIAAIRGLGELREAGLVTEEEFQAKKADLLERI